MSFPRIVERWLGRLADQALLAMDSRPGRALRRAWRNRGAHALATRAWLGRLADRIRAVPVIGRLWKAGADAARRWWPRIRPALARVGRWSLRVAASTWNLLSEGASRTDAIVQRWSATLTHARRAAMSAAARAWRRPWSFRTSSPVNAAGFETPLGCFFACATCSRESILMGARKYSTFRCPSCDARLAVIDPERGLTVVSTARSTEIPPEPATEIAPSRTPPSWNDRTQADRTESASDRHPSRPSSDRVPTGAGSNRYPSTSAR